MFSATRRTRYVCQTQEDIENLPIRGIQNIVALQAGVVQQGGNLYVRGGRAGEVAYYVDGANVTNPLSNSENVSIIQEAVEELQLQAGGFTAEYGGSSSGIVRTNVRTGGNNYKASLDYLTDDFAKPGKSFLGTSSVRVSERSLPPSVVRSPACRI